MNYVRKIGSDWLVVVTLASATWAQNPSVATQAAPVPPTIASAKKVFISNMGTTTSVRWPSDPVDRPCNELYAAVKRWGKYQLVDGPAEADLVYEISSVVTLPSVPSDLELSIVDARTHFRLWTLYEPVNGANRKATWEKNFAKGMTNLVNNLKKLSE